MSTTFWQRVAHWVTFGVALYAVYLQSPDAVPAGIWVAILSFIVAMFAGYPLERTR